MTLAIVQLIISLLWLGVAIAWAVYEYREWRFTRKLLKMRIKQAEALDVEIALTMKRLGERRR